MQEQEKLLKEIVIEIAGEESEKIVDLLHKKKNVNEFLIAKKLDLTINQTRNILYKLGDLGLVSFVRKKDKKKGGWYTYFWTLNSGKAIDLLRIRILDKLEKLEDDLGKRKKERFYHNPDVGIEYSEQDALENDFIDPETGSVLELKDNSENVLLLEKEVAVLKEILEGVQVELEEIEKKEEQAKQRKLKAEAKKKAEERAIRRKKLAKERAKLGLGKKKTKKKVKKKTKKKVKKKTKKKVKKKTKKKVKKKTKKKTKKVTKGKKRR